MKTLPVAAPVVEVIKMTVIISNAYFFLKESKFYKISLLSEGLIDKWAFVQVMACCQG